MALPGGPGRALPSTTARLVQTGADLGAAPYGTEAPGIMPIEKGHAADNELNGQTTALRLWHVLAPAARRQGVPLREPALRQSASPGGIFMPR